MKPASLLATMAVMTTLFISHPAAAQSSVDELLEKARGQAQGVEKLKDVINKDPDPNMRLATFNLMIEDGDKTMQAIALESGLASADKLIQSAAFKAAIMDLERLHLTLKVDTSASDEIKDRAKAHLAKNGNDYVIELQKKDRKTGKFRLGEVSGTQLTFKSGHDTGVLSLVDDNAVGGSVTLYSGGFMEFTATGTFR